MTGTPIVVAKDLGKDFREGFLLRRKTAVAAVSFTLERGAIYGFLGPNGAGKTTCLHLLMGFLRPSRGWLTVFGREPGNPESRRLVGFLPERFAFDRFSTGWTLLRRFDAIAGRPVEGREERARKALEAVDLLSSASRRVGSYSKGMTQRIGLAQALLGDPELLILDEPMSGMDPGARRLVRGILERRRERGGTTLFSTHILSDVEALADHVLILDRGRTVVQGSLALLKGRERTTTIVFRDDNRERWKGVLEERRVACEPILDEPDAYKIETRDAKTKNTILFHLVSGGADILSVVPRSASLESLFLQLTGEKKPESSEES